MTQLTTVFINTTDSNGKNTFTKETVTTLNFNRLKKLVKDKSKDCNITCRNDVNNEPIELLNYNSITKEYHDATL